MSRSDNYPCLSCTDTVFPPTATVTKEIEGQNEYGLRRGWVDQNHSDNYSGSVGIWVPTRILEQRSWISRPRSCDGSSDH